MSEQSSNAAPAANVAAPSAEGQVAAEASASSESSESEGSEEAQGEPSAIETQQAADAKEVLEDPNASKKEKAEARKTLKQLKLKVNGKEIVEDLPFEIPDDEKSKAWMTKQLQLGKAGQQSMSEKAALEKEVNAFVEMLKKNPRKILSDPNIGIDVKKLAAEIIEDEIENSKKSPEQLRAEKLEAELKALKEQQEEEKKVAQQKEFERIQQQEYERYDMLMSQALEKSDLPKSPYVVKKMADTLLLGLDKGLDLTPQDVLPIVREEILADIKEMFSVMPEEVIESIVGSEKINSLRKKKVAAAKAAAGTKTTTANQVKDTGSNTKKAEEPPKKIHMKDFFKL